MVYHNYAGLNDEVGMWYHWTELQFRAFGVEIKPPWSLTVGNCKADDSILLEVTESPLIIQYWFMCSPNTTTKLYQDA